MAPSEYYTRIVRSELPSIEGGVPKYRTKSGLRCPIGLLIPDTHHTPKMETVPVRGLIAQWGEGVLETVQGFELKDLEAIQKIHDSFLCGTQTRKQFLIRLKELPCFNFNSLER